MRYAAWLYVVGTFYLLSSVLPPPPPPPPPPQGDVQINALCTFAVGVREVHQGYLTTVVSIVHFRA
jgi:hypothetical protein